VFLSYSFTDLCHVTVGQHVKVRLQAGIMNGFPIPVCFERSTETNIVANGGILLEKFSAPSFVEIIAMTNLDPGALGAIRDGSTNADRALCPAHLANQALEK
jgi:hypothetical protein